MVEKTKSLFVSPQWFSLWIFVHWFRPFFSCLVFYPLVFCSNGLVDYPLVFYSFFCPVVFFRTYVSSHIYWAVIIFSYNRPIILFNLFLFISMANSFATPEPLTNINLDQDLLGDVDSRTVAYISIYRKITQPEFPMRKNFIHRHHYCLENANNQS